jgi:single-stranded DNA-binding protein
MAEITELHCARLCGDPKLKTIGGKEVVEFSVAVDDGYGDKKVTNFYSVKSSNKKLPDLLGKGCLVFVRGKVKTRTADDGKVYRDVWTNSFDDVVVYTYKKKSETAAATEEPPPF